MKNGGYKLSKLLLAILNATFLVLFLGLYLAVWLGNSSLYKQSVLLPVTSIIAVLGMAYFITNFKDNNKAKQTTDFLNKNYILLLCLGTGLLLLVQIYLGYKLNTNIGWDVGRIMEAAQATDLRLHDDYFSWYPNNLLLFFSYRTAIVIFTKVGISEIWFGLVLVNIVAVDIALLLATACAKELLGIKYAYICWGISALLFGLFPWLIVPYSDTLSMPFAIGTFYCFLKINKAETKKGKTTLAMLMGFFIAIGYLLKPTIIIVFIAIVLLTVLTNLAGEKKWKELLWLCVLPTIVFGIIIGVFSLFIQKQQMLKIDKNLKATPWSFMMLGISKLEFEEGYILYGTWNEEDAQIIMNTTTQQELNRISKDTIKQRMNEMGLGGYSAFLFNKLKWIFSDGTFFWGQEGNFANFKEIKPGILKQLFTPTEKWFTIYVNTSYFIWLTVLLLQAAPLLSVKKEFKNKNISIIRCLIVGVVLFLLLFEGRSRYLIPFLPFFTVLASYGFGTLEIWFGKKHNKKIMVGEKE